MAESEDDAHGSNVHAVDVTLTLRVSGRGDPEKIARLVHEALRDGADVEESFSDEEENGAQAKVEAVALTGFKVVPIWALPPCQHDWQEQEGEPPVDVCSSCGERRE